MPDNESGFASEQARSPTLLELHLHTGDEFLALLAHDIAACGPGDRIALTTMSFEPSEPAVTTLMQALYTAGEHDADIHFGIDAYTFMLDGNTQVGPYFIPLPIVPRAFKRRAEAINKLGEFPGAHTNVINAPKRPLTNPIAGRSHIKAAVVGDTVYLPGANLHKTDRADSAISFTDPVTADRLYNLLTNLVETGSTHETLGGIDQLWQLDAATQLLIDAGIPGQSVTYESALQIVESSEARIIFGSQYAPRGKIAAALGRAVARNIDVTALFNTPRVQGNLGMLPERHAIRRGRRTLPPELFAHILPNTQYYHVKSIANERSGQTGNSNADERGVKLGTAEISIRRNDPTFAGRLARLSLTQASITEFGDWANS